MNQNFESRHCELSPLFILYSKEVYLDAAKDSNLNYSDKSFIEGARWIRQSS